MATGSDGLVVPHRLSVVIPVYRGETTLPAVVDDVLAMPGDWTTPGGHRIVIGEVLLVWDHGPDRSDEVIRALTTKYERVRPIWLTRNYGQHAATLAGMASSGGDWVATIDEDGQHDIRFVADMLDVALAEQAPVVYAKPTNEPPHGWLRNVASRTAKRSITLLTGSRGAEKFQSFRLVLGELARSVAAYAGSGVYLDVALGWVVPSVAQCPVELRYGSDRPSGYTLRTLMSHYWRMVISSGTRILRVVSAFGLFVAIVGVLGALLLIILSATGTGSEVRGWASTMVVLLLTAGATLFSLGVIAEYVGAAVNMAMGKPLYLIGSDPDAGPLGRRSR